jgi:hypothetical protein
MAASDVATKTIKLIAHSPAIATKQLVRTRSIFASSPERVRAPLPL